MTDAAPVLRVARATDDLDRLMPFYRDALGLTLLVRFDDHDGFDGVVLGHPDAPWHLEFTTGPHPAPPRGHGDDLIVLYLPERAAWDAAVRRLEAAGHRPVAPANPYWARSGRTYADPDGNRIVLQNGAWTG